MLDLEAEMLKALDGKFFWEHTSHDDPKTSGDEYQIRVAQRNFYKPKAKTPEELRSEELEKLKGVIQRRKGGVMQYNAVDTLKPEDLKEFATDLASVIADVYGVDVEEVSGRTRGMKSFFGKHHYPWAMIRYFPLIPLRKIATAIGKDRATVYHSDGVFTQRESEFKDHIIAVDTLVGYA